MIGGVDVGLGSTSSLVVTNGTIQNYYANSGTIDPYTFVYISNGKISPSSSTINGVTISTATATIQGQVYVLGSGS